MITPIVFTSKEATTACESLKGMQKFIRYAKLRNFLKNDLATRELAELSLGAMDRNWNLQRHFGQIKMISSNPQSERAQTSQKELASIGLTLSDYEMAPGVDGSKLDKALWSRMVKWGTDKLSKQDCIKKLQGQTGCYRAQYNAIKDTAERYRAAVVKLNALRVSGQATSPELLAAIDAVHKYRSLLIFEDNVGFGKVTSPLSADKTGYGQIFRQAMSELEEGWDMLYFMSMYGAQKVSTHLALLDYGLTTKCYAISAKMYDRVLQALEVMNIPGHEIKPVDHMLAQLHKEARCLVTLPPLCYRAASMSEVGGNLRKKKGEVPTHWQSEVSVKKSAKEEVLLHKEIEAHCAAADNFCALPDLAARAIELRDNQCKKAKQQLDPVNKFTKKSQELGDKHKKLKTKSSSGMDLHATDIMGRQNFIFASCPKNYATAGALISVLLSRQGKVLVSTLESHEAKNKGNNFWKQSNISKLEMTDGWKIEHEGEVEIGHGDENSKLVETRLRATNGVVERTLTHLHYDGWVDRTAAPDDRLLFALVMRMRALNPDPTVFFSINCHGGIGRTGTTGMCVELFNEIDAQVKEGKGKALDEIRLNILDTLFKMRMRGRDIVHQAAAFAQIFAVVGMYYKYLKIQKAITQVGGEVEQLTRQSIPALIAEYAVSD